MTKTVKPTSWWPSPAGQYVDLGEWRYDVAGILFEARELEPFEIPMRALDYRNWSCGWSEGGLREFVMHMHAVNQADLSYPIVLCPDGALIDGRHRLAKALLEGRTHITAVRFDDEPRSRRRLEPHERTES